VVGLCKRYRLRVRLRIRFHKLLTTAIAALESDRQLTRTRRNPDARQRNSNPALATDDDHQ